jgi:hypothetical protein
VADLQGRRPSDALTRTRFGVVHLWSIDAPQLHLPPAFAVHFHDGYPYPPAPIWPPDEMMHLYHKESLFPLDYAFCNEIEHAGANLGKDGRFQESKGDHSFGKPIIAHILFRLSYELTWTDDKGRSRVFPLKWRVVGLIISELDKANMKMALQNALDVSPLTYIYSEKQRYLAA